MVQKNIRKQPKGKVEIQIIVSWVDLEPKWNKIIQKLTSDVETSNFRKGLTSTDIAEQQLGYKLQDGFIKLAMQEFFVDVLKESDIYPIGSPEYELIYYEQGQGLHYKVIVTNRPIVVVGNYKAIKVVKTIAKSVAEEDIDNVVEDLYKKWQLEKTQNGSRNGEQMNSQNPTWNENFINEMNMKSMSDLRMNIRKNLEEYALYNNELDFEEAILREIEKITVIDLPEVLIDDEINRMLVSLQRKVADMGLLLDDYLKGQKKTVAQLRIEWKPQAERNVRMELGLAEIARLENITITDNELQVKIESIQDSRVKKDFESEKPRLHLRHALRQTKTLNHLKKIIKITYVQ